jgi:two-component system sensor histidine kinase MprB
VSLRARLTLAAAVAVALSIALAAALTYALVRDQLRNQVDDALRQRVEAISRVPLAVDRLPDDSFFLRLPRGGFGDPATYIRVVDAEGTVAHAPGEQLELPVGDDVRAVASGEKGQSFSDAEIGNVPVRVLTSPLGQGFAIQAVRSLAEVESTLDDLRVLLLLITAAGIGLATAAGILVTRTALRPVKRLSEATADVTRTGDLSRRVEADGRDELSRLAANFNEMLEALERSVGEQRQLVADASHELRTPLTSLRTNVEVLALSNGLADDDRQRLLQDVVAQLEEMTVLVSDVVELARGSELMLEPEPVRLDLLVAEAVERAARHSPDVRFESDLEETIVDGVASDLERAVANLLDNAAKWSPPEGVIEIRVRDGEVVVRDHGPGIADEDLPHVFDRFYRAPAARGMPGSGLGLAIVRRVADAHHGDVSAEAAEGGGSRFRLRLPVSQGV